MSATPTASNNRGTAISRPASSPDDIWQKSSFFSCDTCKEVFFNYKQAWIHFKSDEHRAKTKLSASVAPLTSLVDVNKNELVDEKQKQKETIQKIMQQVKEATKAAVPESTSKEKKEIVRPDYIPDDIWQRYYELGNSVADLVLDAFDVYGSGDFASWDKDRARNMFWRLCKVNEKEAINRRNLVCEYILVTRMKERDFFCCDLCQESLFNYKQALIHFMTTKIHKEKEATRRAVRESRIDSVAKLMDTITEIPEICTKADKEFEKRRFNGRISAAFFLFARSAFEKFYRDRAATFDALIPAEALKSGPKSALSLLVATRIAVENVKSELGQMAIQDLHKFLGEFPSHCVYCQFTTGNREEFYAHYTSSVHMRIVADHFKKEQENFHFDPLTILVNVHRKGLA